MSVKERAAEACYKIKLKQDISNVAFGLTNDNMSKEDAAGELLNIINDISEDIL